MRTAIFEAKFENLDAIREYVAQAASEFGFDEAGVYALQLAADEACSNIIEHAYQDEPGGEIECSISMEGGTFILVLRDHGCCFDPESVPEPHLSGSLEDRHIGGLGLYLIRHLMDEIDYQNLGEAGNVLTMKKRLTV